MGLAKKVLKPPLLVITGQTASGKSDIVHKLAKVYPIEIIHADSRQVYRYMQIGTAQPSEQALSQAPYHLVGFLDPSEEYSAGRFLKDCKGKISEIYTRKHIPLITGGSFFYIKALWDGLMKEPRISTELQKEVENMAPEQIEIELEKADPKSFKRIHKNNLQRRRRALLVSISTKRPFSSFEREGGIYEDYSIRSWVLDPPRQELHSNIEERIHNMIKMGWLEEVNALVQRGFTKSSPGLQSLGYKEILQVLEKESLNSLTRNTTSLRELLKAINQKTRQFAKRQMTWFRSENRLKKIDHASLFHEVSKCIGKLI